MNFVDLENGCLGRCLIDTWDQDATHACQFHGPVAFCRYATTLLFGKDPAQMRCALTSPYLRGGETKIEMKSPLIHHFRCDRWT